MECHVVGSNPTTPTTDLSHPPPPRSPRSERSLGRPVPRALRPVPWNTRRNGGNRWPEGRPGRSRIQSCCYIQDRGTCALHPPTAVFSTLRAPGCSFCPASTNPFGGSPMPTYILLSRFTQQGRESINQGRPGADRGRAQDAREPWRENSLDPSDAGPIRFGRCRRGAR